MDYIPLSLWQVGTAAALILLCGGISLALQLGLAGRLALAAVRTVVQLLLVGLVLESVFAWQRWELVLMLVLTMTLAAGISAASRNTPKFAGIYLNSLVSIAASSWLMTAFAVVLVIRQTNPWWHPQYLIPLLGMILGNSLNGVSLGLSALGADLIARRDRIESMLSLGATRFEAARPSIQQAVRTGMIPMINSMMIVGIVSLPGMMTGQILSGTAPEQAARYQIVIMFLIAAATALATMSVVLLSCLRLFNKQHQFLYERLSP